MDTKNMKRCSISLAIWEMQIRTLKMFDLGLKDRIEEELEKAMAPHSSTLAWRIPGTGEPGGLSSLGSHRVGHD